MTAPKYGVRNSGGAGWRARIRRAAVRLCLVVLVVGAAVLTAELGLGIAYRWQPLSPTYFLPSDQPPFYTLMPGASAVQVFHLPVTITIDRHGRRVVPTAPGSDTEGDVTTVHLVGDSQVFGWALSDDQTIPAQLQDMLGPGYRVINHGLPGAGPYYYDRILSQIPSDAWVVLLQTEHNDLTDAYMPWSTMRSRCGSLLNDSGLASTTPCWVIRSYTFHMALGLWHRLTQNHMSLPPSFNQYAVPAARTLDYRVRRLYEPHRQMRGRHMIVGLIPWDGLVVPERQSAYRPAIEAPQRVVQWIDELDLETLFQNYADAESLFIPGDPHLSAAGAELVATCIAQRLLERHHVD